MRLVYGATPSRTAAGLVPMNTLLEELTAGMPDPTEFMRVVIRLLAAMLLGAIVGLQREWAGKAAGVRTHMLVALGCALFVMACAAAEMSMEGLSRVIQGVATGIGFIGAGAILKDSESHSIEGLTTSAGIWVTSAAGIAVGLGQLGIALLGMVLAWIVLTVLGALTRRLEKRSG